MATSIDDYIKSISLHSPRPILLHGYILPFTVIYAVWLYYWTVVYGISEYYEPGLIVLAIIAVAQILVSLSCYWSVQIRAFLTCGKVNSIDEASIAQIVPTVNNGWPELVTIHKQDGRAWFIFQKLKYVFDPKLERNFSTIKFPVNEDMLYYKSAKGLCDIDVKSAKSIYGSNDLTMDIPPFVELFIERATAPFFVFQVFCVGLWCLDEYWYYSVFTLFMLILFEATLVHQQLRNMAMIREMGTKPYPINVYRDSRWATIMTNELLPGDIVSLTRSVDDTPIPCDVLLLQGSCIVDESMLTGESVPVMKECIQQLEGDRSLDLEADSKLHLLFGGTRVVQCTPSKTSLKHVKAPSQGCVGFVLRTSFNSSQGTLLRTILFSVKRITANNLETFLFILFLLIFAIAASSYVWIKGTEDPTRSRYKLFLECTLILTSVVPPELPIELSLAVNSSLLALVQFSIYCTEPFRIPFAGKIDVCCFDKTGTLTSDDLIVDGIAGLNDDDPCALVPLTDAPTSTIQVLASCQSLVLLNDSELVGDPMEKATLNAIQWKVTKSDGVVPDSNSSVKLPGMKVTLRHHFSSSLKRMTVVASQLDPHNSMMARYICTVKGAPETLQSMFKLVPDHYESTYLSLARRGARVIALGYREIGTSLPEKLKQMNREELEKDLVFAGFIALSCPLKPDSKSSMKEIQASSHHIMMITGDNPLTACHIGRELKMTRKPHTLILTQRSASQSDEWLWKSVDETIEVKLDGDVDRSTLKDYDLCITGQGLNHLQNEGLLAKFVPCTSIFARVAPKQKELVITTLKEQGYHTLMCGDGTNDVAALKHAHVGVALLSAIPKLKKNKDKGTDMNGQKLEKPVSDEAVIKSAGSVSRPLSLSSNRPLSSSRPLSSNRPLAARSSNRRAVTSGRDMSGRSANDRAAKIEKLLKEMDEQDNTVVKLGDASIASPFTSKYSTINSVCHIIKQGRCTLVTTLQMFKILALNALILAYTQSVLYLDGIKFSDTQATMQGLLLAGCFLFKSRSKPLKTLSKRRPLTNIFNVYTIATVLLQFALHFSSLVFLAKEAHARMPPKEERFVDLERKFEPSLLNSTMYLIAIGMQLSTFAVNYKGKPFMESLTENKPMFYSLLCSCGFLVVLASGLMPDLQAYFEIVEFPAEFRNLVIMVLLADFIGAYVVDSICVFIFEHPKAKSVW